MKKIYGFTFCFIIIVMNFFNGIVIDKSINRYYMLKHEVSERKDDVIILGSCHAYTSFNPLKLIEEYGVSAYNRSNPSESMPVTYLQLKQIISDYCPKVVLIEAWGINYDSSYVAIDDAINYQKKNLECMPLSCEKLIIDEQLGINKIYNNLLITEYKSRIIEGTITQIDFDYSYLNNRKNSISETYNWLFQEMDNRLSRNGYLPNKANPILDNDFIFKNNHSIIIEPNTIVIEYLRKIIELCNEHHISLIFYKAPYEKNYAEVGHYNWLCEFLKSYDIEYYDLEKELIFDYNTDFCDNHHLSVIGAEKVTTNLSNIILENVSDLCYSSEIIKKKCEYDFNFNDNGFIDPDSGEYTEAENYKYTYEKYPLNNLKEFWLLLDQYTPTMVLCFYNNEAEYLGYYSVDNFSSYVSALEGATSFSIYTDKDYSGIISIYESCIID